MLVENLRIQEVALAHIQRTQSKERVGHADPVADFIAQSTHRIEMSPSLLITLTSKHYLPHSVERPGFATSCPLLAGQRECVSPVFLRLLELALLYEHQAPSEHS